jgi:hypothetical protein
MTHHTKDKGDLATAIVIADLTSKGYTCFIPVVSEHLPFDIIAYKDSKCIRIQSKHSYDGEIPARTSWTDKHGSHSRYYSDNDFEYYAIYSPQLNKVMYPSIKYKGKSITYTIPNSATPFNWYEDFLDFTDFNTKKTYKDFNHQIKREETEATIAWNIKNRKVTRPTKEELYKLLWEKPLTEIAKAFGVSDKSVAKWAKQYGLEKPARGHWITK